MAEAPMSVLVTGAASGFGELTVKTLARAGYRVFAAFRDIHGRRRDVAEAFAAWAEQENVYLRVVEMDVADDESVRSAVASVIEQAGNLDVVVNNAGISSRGPIEAFSMDQVQQLFNTNVFGPLRVNQAVLPHMRARQFGVLIHISSTLGRVLPRAGGLYPASNWAREGLAESQRYELKPFNIEVAILEPGSFPTPAVGAGLPAANAEVTAEYAAVAAPRRRDPYGPNPPDPQDVADAVLALIETPHGERPLRTVVGPVFTQGVPEYNATYEETRDNLRAILDRLWD